MALHSRRDSHESALLRAGLTLKRKDGKAIVFVGDKAALVPRELHAQPEADPGADGGPDDAAAPGGASVLEEAGTPPHEPPRG